ncbi:MAG TPA: HAD hydrolase-like protein [Myxococcota bacterium]|nr:HAD hydrolase-like protein [Myxococcota bacterium]
MRALLFDLDGTLTDSKPGITRGIQHALRKRGLPVPDGEALEPCIGPPLERSFRELLGLPADAARQALADYREYFDAQGWRENSVYAGIPELLGELRGRDVRLVLATAKPTVFAERILAHFGLAKHFESVVASHLDGRRVDKEELIADALAALAGVERAEVAHVGDRSHDVVGARANGIASIAVAYGYGTPAELAAARPDALADSVTALGGLLRGRLRRRC